MECLVCKYKNPKDAKFCNQCGQKFSLIPSSINKNSSYDKHIDVIQRFLPKGLIEKIMSQKGKIEGEKRKVTVMFCDIEGFTSMVEKLGPEKAYSMMDEIYEILIHKVHEFEGTVNEMTGDGIMALFGAPVALEDAPIQALRSALSIHDKISNFNNLKKNSLPIRMRIGIHTGPVVVGALGNDLRVEFKAVGNTVNLASRMEGLAEPASTYVTKATYQLAKELFQFEKLGEKRIKGKKEPRLWKERCLSSPHWIRTNDLFGNGW
jgi:class 3 adenylate cyclase